MRNAQHESVKEAASPISISQQRSDQEPLQIPPIRVELAHDQKRFESLSTRTRTRRYICVRTFYKIAVKQCTMLCRCRLQLLERLWVGRNNSMLSGGDRPISYMYHSTNTILQCPLTGADTIQPSLIIMGSSKNDMHNLTTISTKLPTSIYQVCLFEYETHSIASQKSNATEK